MIHILICLFYKLQYIIVQRLRHFLEIHQMIHIAQSYMGLVKMSMYIKKLLIYTLFFYTFGHLKRSKIKTIILIFYNCI
jgi:hypothetical protein